MYDSVKLWDPSITLFENNRILSRLVNVREEYIPSTGKINYRGQLSNLRVRIYSSRLCVEGSWPKYIRGNNLHSLSTQEIKTAIEKLSDELGMSIENAIVSRVEIAETFTMSYPISYYISYLGSLKYCKRTAFGKGLMYLNKQKALTFYDKIEEMIQNKQIIPKELTKENLLRYELKLNKKVSRQLKLAIITTNMLCKKELFDKFIEKWQKEYFSIHRINKPVVHSIEIIRNTRHLINFLAINGLQYIGYIDTLNMLDSFKRNLSKIQLHRLKKKIKELVQNKHFTEPSELIVELDQKVKNTALSYLG